MGSAHFQPTVRLMQGLNTSPSPSLGRGLLFLRKKFGHGFRAAYYRDRVRPRILSTRPVECGDSTCEIHVLTSEADWLNLLWALKTFYFYSERRYGLCIHDDGSLSSDALRSLRFHFPGARIIDRKQADQSVGDALKAYPRCLRLRQTNHFGPKLMDFVHYLKGDRMMLIDSDILFFAAPRVLLERIENPAYKLNTVNPDVGSAYTVKAEDVKRICGIDLPSRFNSGLGLIHRESMRFDWIEEFLTLPGIDSHFWRIEQTTYALCSARYGVELLPEEYAVRFSGSSEGLPSRHYVGPIRHLMYSDGIRRLVAQKFLESQVSTRGLAG
jgi:hypothetical protein